MDANDFVEKLNEAQELMRDEKYKESMRRKMNQIEAVRSEDPLSEYLFLLEDDDEKIR